MSNAKDDRKLAAAINIQSVARGHAARKQYASQLRGGLDYDGRGHELAVGATGWSIHYAPPVEKHPHGRQFWHHTGSGTSVWEEPSEAKIYREATSVDSWNVHPGPTGEAYWFNKETQQSVAEEPEVMKKRREEYLRNTANIRSGRQQGGNQKHVRFNQSKMSRVLPTTTTESMQFTVNSVLTRLRALSADEDPKEAFRLFALNDSHSQAEIIPLSAFAASVQALCPGVKRPLALATARVFDRSQSGVVSERTFCEIIFDRSELSQHRADAVHEQVLVILDEIRDMVATTVSEIDGLRGFSGTELRRHFNNMKAKPTHKGISRGRFVTVMKHLELSNDSATLHALVDEFDTKNVGYLTFDQFCNVIKRDKEEDHHIKKHSEWIAAKEIADRRRPRPSKRTEKEARIIIAKFQRHFHTRTSTIDQLHDVFDAFDRYDDGHIARADFMVAMRHMDFSRSTDALHTVCDILDPENTGYIAWHTFFDHLALEAKSGLTPRCLKINKNIERGKAGKAVQKMNQRSGMSPRHHGQSSSPQRSSRMLQMERPSEYPEPGHDADYEDVMMESRLLLQELESRLVREARIQIRERRKEEEERREEESSSEEEEVRRRKKDNKSSSRRPVIPKLNIHEISGASKEEEVNRRESKEEKEEQEKREEEKIEVSPVDFLSYLVNVFDTIDVDNAGAVRASMMFRHLKK